MDGQTPPAAYEFGDFRLDVRQRLLLTRADGHPLPLTSRAFDTLIFFLEHPGELLDKATLMAAVWPKLVVEENNLNQSISLLRRVLGERPEEHRFIVTIPGRGYRFVAAVRAVGEEADPSPSVAAADPESSRAASVGRDTVAVAAEEGAPEPDRGARRRRGVFWSAIGGAGVALAAALTWYTLTTRRPAPTAALSTATSIEVVPVLKPRLAVLPFENLSPDPSNAFFADGLHEEIVSTIAERVRGVEVISRTTMMSYRSDPPKPLAVVARDLRASHLLEGSVRREANKIRLTLQLIDARTDGLIWSANYDRTLADTLTLESQVAAEVAGQLSAQLIQTEERAPIQDTQAFDLYLKAVLALRALRGEPAGYQVVEDLLKQVIDRQPTFALAYAQRARLLTLKFITGADTSESLVSRIRSDLDMATRLAPREPHVLAATGYFLMCANDTTGALKAYAAAEAAGLAEPEWLIPKAHLLLRRSRIDELKATTQRMLALDPANQLVITFAIYHFALAGEPLDAWRATDYARAFPPQDEDERAYVLLLFTGRTQEARSFLQQHGPPGDWAQVPPLLPRYHELLRFEGRYAQLRQLIDRVPVESYQYYSGTDYGPIGMTPTALFRGWTDMLLEDRTAAAKDGRAVLRFLEKQPETPWNRVFLEIFAAEGFTLTGECERARSKARNGLSLISRADNAIIWSTAATHVALISAWCGAPDEAVGILRQLSAAKPGIAPAMVTRDPLFTVPLGQLPEFRALAGQLENEMRVTRLQLSAR
jgi:TolB-like protein/DNA-binding winged helix-turn-helix (wHTH) protein